MRANKSLSGCAPAPSTPFMLISFLMRGARLDDAQRGQRCPYGVRDIGGREVGVMLLGHPRVGVPELRRDNAHWDAPPGQGAGVCVPQDVERRGRINPCSDARILKRPLLVGLAPTLPAVAGEDDVTR
jgi:hypothetical protein